MIVSALVVAFSSGATFAAGLLVLVRSGSLLGGAIAILSACSLLALVLLARGAP